MSIFENKIHAKKTCPTVIFLTCMGKSNHVAFLYNWIRTLSLGTERTTWPFHIYDNLYYWKLLNLEADYIQCISGLKYAH